MGTCCINARAPITVAMAFVIMAMAISFTTVIANPPAEQVPGLMQPAWNITHGGARADEGWGVAVGADGSVYFAGYDRIDPGRVTADVFLKKLTPDGTLLWSAKWGGVFDDEAFTVTTSGDYVYVGGRSFPPLMVAGSGGSPGAWSC